MDVQRIDGVGDGPGVWNIIPIEGGRICRVHERIVNFEGGIQRAIGRS